MKRAGVAVSSGREKNSGWRDVARSETHGGLRGDFGEEIGDGWASSGGRLAQKSETRDGAASTRARKQRATPRAGKRERRIHLSRRERERETNDVRDKACEKEKETRRGERTRENGEWEGKKVTESGSPCLRERYPDGKENVAEGGRLRKEDGEPRMISIVR